MKVKMKFHRRFKQLHKKKWESSYTLYDPNTREAIYIPRKCVRSVMVGVRRGEWFAFIALKRKYKGLQPRLKKETKIK